MKPSPSSPIIAVDEDEADIFLLRRLLMAGKVDRPFLPLLSPEAFKAWLPTAFAAHRKGTVPAVCFLDIKMIGGTGLELLQWVRQDNTFNDLPIVMLSSSEDPQDLSRAAELGAQCYLTKYPSSATLREVINDADAWTGEANKAAFEKPYNLLPKGRNGMQ